MAEPLTFVEAHGNTITLKDCFTVSFEWALYTRNFQGKLKVVAPGKPDCTFGISDPAEANKIEAWMRRTSLAMSETGGSTG